MSEIARIPPGGRRELGLVNYVISRIAARQVRAPHMHLFEVLGQHKMLFLTFLPYAGQLLNKGKLPKTETELVILRVGHLRGSEYELQQHRRLARSRGVDDALQAKIFEGPDAEGLTSRQRALLRAVDEFTFDPKETYAIVCGPPVMFKFVCSHLDRLGIPMNRMFVSLERRMHCGMGKCCRCMVGSTFTCLDGPVFDYWSVMNLKEAI